MVSQAWSAFTLEAVVRTLWLCSQVQNCNDFKVSKTTKQTLYQKKKNNIMKIVEWERSTALCLISGLFLKFMVNAFIQEA